MNLIVKLLCMVFLTLFSSFSAAKDLDEIAEQAEVTQLSLNDFLRTAQVIVQDLRQYRPDATLDLIEIEKITHIIIKVVGEIYKRQQELPKELADSISTGVAREVAIKDLLRIELDITELMWSYLRFVHKRQVWRSSLAVLFIRGMRVPKTEGMRLSPYESMVLVYLNNVEENFGDDLAQLMKHKLIYEDIRLAYFGFLCAHRPEKAATLEGFIRQVIEDAILDIESEGSRVGLIRFARFANTQNHLLHDAVLQHLASWEDHRDVDTRTLKELAVILPYTKAPNELSAKFLELRRYVLEPGGNTDVYGRLTRAASTMKKSRLEAPSYVDLAIERLRNGTSPDEAKVFLADEGDHVKRRVTRRWYVEINSLTDKEKRRVLHDIAEIEPERLAAAILRGLLKVDENDKEFLDLMHSIDLCKALVEP